MDPKRIDELLSSREREVTVPPFERVRDRLGRRSSLPLAAAAGLVAAVVLGLVLGPQIGRLRDELGDRDRGVAETPTPTPSVPVATPSPTAALPTETATPPVMATMPPIASPLPAPPAAAGPSPTAVHFADRLHGWLGVEDGVIGTTDAGATWQRQLTGPRVGRLWSVDATHAWALAADNTIYRTRDGLTWAPMPPTTPPIVDIDFVSVDIGWAIASPPLETPIGGRPRRVGTLLKTIDGGAVWRPITPQPLWSVCFTNEREGMGANGKQILRTTDGGQTWAVLADLTINDEGPWYPELACVDAQRARVQITEPYAALSHAPYLVFRTTNGGSAWQLEYAEGYTVGTTVAPFTPSLGSYPSQLWVLPNGRTAVLTCSPSMDTQDLFVLDAGGAVVSRQSVPFQQTCARASVIDEQHAWAIINVYLPDRTLAAVVRTSDGGAGWEYVYPR
ncbi:MAG: WD40/YVTN/BNR-like repeat-containing protein [Candidatus Limnocylindria bacterium]